MSGFSTSRSGQGIDNIAKQYGSVLRGWGPPAPKAGVVGDLYIDNVTLQMFEKRRVNSLDDWGHYLWVIPPAYKNSLKWFGPSGPNNSLGMAGDHFLQWGGYNNYGMQMTIWGPKLVSGWPENGEGPNDGSVVVQGDLVRSTGLASEGPALMDKAPDKLIAMGLFAEYVIPGVITADPSDPVMPIGLPSTGTPVNLTLNPLYTAEDEHAL